MELVNNLAFNTVIAVVIFGASSYLGILAYSQDKKSSANRIFARFSIATAFWILLAFIPDIPNFRNFALLSAKLNYLTLLIVSVTLFEFPFYFPKERKPKKALIYFIYLIAVTIGLLVIFTNKVIFGLDYFGWGASYIDGDMAGIFYIFMLLGPIFSITNYVFMWRTLDKFEKRKLRYFLFGLFSFLAVNIILQSIVKPLFVHTDALYKFGNYSAVFMIGLTSYSIIRYRLFDIRIVAAEVFTFVIWIILFSRLFSSQTSVDLSVNVFVFVLISIFGMLLIKSLKTELSQKEKLLFLNEKLKNLDKQKNEFINMAAHELRAPITAIKGYISMIMEGDAGVIPEKAIGYLTDVNSVNERLIRLVNNMLNVSRIEEGRLIYNTEVVKLSDVAHSIYVSFKFEAERKGLKFSINIPEHIDDKIEVDPDRLNEVIGNFVSNSVKYTETGEISINISQPTKDRIHLGVKDTGPGISKEEQDKLFQKFYRVESTAGKTIGTGLGLYISKLLVEKFNGKIGLKSELGKGSEFWFELPVSDKPLTTEVEHDNNEAQNEVELKTLREKEKATKHK
ncbi:hypothetical protein IPM62_06030 [Candidatus Woesebacteria bacterium]|nr:MAG: hypothetical protein IPM62_06030 [Candidatus Woesebacteria bacterium]